MAITIFTTESSDVVLDPDSMIDGAPLKSTPTDLFKKLDALIEDVEKDSAKLKNTDTTDVMYCDLYLCDKDNKTFKLHGPVEEFEINLPYRIVMCLQVPGATVEYFLKFCLSSCLGSNKNKILLEHCETSFSKKAKKTVMVTRHAKGRHKNYLRLDFFKTVKTANGKMALNLEFISI